jgi:hypothetical protein
MKIIIIKKVAFDFSSTFNYYWGSLLILPITLALSYSPISSWCWRRYFITIQNLSGKLVELRKLNTGDKMSLHHIGWNPIIILPLMLMEFLRVWEKRRVKKNNGKST